MAKQLVRFFCSACCKTASTTKQQLHPLILADHLHACCIGMAMMQPDNADSRAADNMPEADFDDPAETRELMQEIGLKYNGYICFALSHCF